MALDLYISEVRILIFGFKKETGVSKMQLIENIFGSRGRIKVLKKMSQHTGWWFNTTELSRDMNVNKGAISKILNELENDNLIIVNRKGKIKLFMLNEKSAFVSEIIMPIFRMEDELFKYIKKSITKSFPDDYVSSVILYGSYARGSERLNSDIDVMVVAKNASFEKKCAIIVDKISSTFLNKGMLLTIDIITTREFKRLYMQNEPAILSLAKTGIVLKGDSISEMIR